MVVDDGVGAFDATDADLIPAAVMLITEYLLPGKSVIALPVVFIAWEALFISIAMQREQAPFCGFSSAK